MTNTDKKLKEIKQRETMKRWSWFGLFFFGLGIIIVPDWSDKHTRLGALIGLVAALYIAAYSYHLQWRKRLTQKQLNQGRKQHSFATSGKLLLGTASGLCLTRLLNGSEFESYAKGGAFTFLVIIEILVLASIYAKKGLFQKPVNKAANRRKITHE